MSASTKTGTPRAVDPLDSLFRDGAGLAAPIPPPAPTSSVNPHTIRVADPEWAAFCAKVPHGQRGLVFGALLRLFARDQIPLAPLREAVAALRGPAEEWDGG